MFGKEEGVKTRPCECLNNMWKPGIAILLFYIIDDVLMGQ